MSTQAATAAVDLDAYCARICYDGPRTPTLDTLRALLELHPAVIPFEAIDVLLDYGVDLTPAAVDHKLITARRGGYCYEHNGLLKRVLTTIGFQVEGLAARVRWMKPAAAPPGPRSHMALRVTIDGRPWLADAGFGTIVPTAPLRMDMPQPQPTRQEAFRLTAVADELLLEARLGDQWAPIYQLSQQPQLDVDYVMPNWYTSTHPSSHFRHNLMLALTTPQARYTLLHNRLTIRRDDGQSERHDLSAAEIEHHLSTTFGLTVAPEWRPLIERAVAQGKA